MQLLPLYTHYKRQEKAYQRRIHKLLHVDLPAIIPQLGEATEFEGTPINGPSAPMLNIPQYADEYEDTTFVPDNPLARYYYLRNGTDELDRNPNDTTVTPNDTTTSPAPETPDSPGPPPSVSPILSSIIRQAFTTSPLPFSTPVTAFPFGEVTEITKHREAHEQMLRGLATLLDILSIDDSQSEAILPKSWLASQEEERQEASIGPPVELSPDEKRQILHLNVPSTTTMPENHYREKRGLDIFGIIGGVNSLINTHEIGKMKHVMNIMKQRVDVNTKQIKVIDQDLSALAKCTLIKITRLKNLIDFTNSRIDSLTTVVTQLNSRLNHNSDGILENKNAIKVLTILVGKMMALSERNLSQYQELITTIDHFLDALDTLSTGHLSHNVLEAGQIRDLLADVKHVMKDSYYDYELVMPSVQEYYDLPMISFAYQEGMLLINIPILIKPIQQKALSLYNIRTVPVPFHIRHEHDTDPTQNQNSYTWYKPTHEVLGMSDTNFISLALNQLDTCMHIGTGYFCEGLMLMKQRDTHTCESAIFWDMPAELVRQKCTFTYYQHLVPEPTILDAGNEILLAGLPLPWKFLCHHDQEIPKTLTGAKYAIIAKKDLCLCSISAGDYFLQENIITCQGDTQGNRDFQLKFTVNNAVKLFFPDKFKNFVPLDFESNLALEPYPDHVEDLDIISTADSDVLDQYDDGVDMADLVNKIDKHGQAYIHQVEKIGEIPNMSTWFTGKHITFGFLLLLGLLGVVALIIGGFLLYKHRKTADTIGAVSYSLSKLGTAAATISTAAQIPGANAVVTEDEVKRVLDHILTQTSEIQASLAQEPLTWRFGAYTLMFFVVLCSGYLLWKLLKQLIQSFYVNWLLSPTYKSAFGGCRLWVNKTDLYIQITSDQRVNDAVHLYLGSVEAYPTQIKCRENKYKIGGFSYIRNQSFDALNISWENVSFQTHEQFWPPSNVMIPMFQKWSMRRMFNRKQLKYQLYLKHGKEIMILSGHYSLDHHGNKTESELKNICRSAATEILISGSSTPTTPPTQLNDKPYIKPRVTLDPTRTSKRTERKQAAVSHQLNLKDSRSPQTPHDDHVACTRPKQHHHEPHIIPERADVLYKACDSETQP
jgi:hypothetical protein